MNVLTENDVAVPVRDGTVLRANVFRPDGEGRFPGLLLRTPYGKPKGGFERFVRSGFAVVTQDSRGRYASEGDYVPFTVEKTGDAEDGYDSVECWPVNRGATDASAQWAPPTTRGCSGNSRSSGRRTSRRCAPIRSRSN